MWPEAIAVHTVDWNQSEVVWFSFVKKMYLISLENNKYFDFITSSLRSHWFVSRTEWKTLSSSGSRAAVVMKGCPAFTLYYTTHYLSNDDLSALSFLLPLVQNKKYSSQVIVTGEKKVILSFPSRSFHNKNSWEGKSFQFNFYLISFLAIQHLKYKW